MRKSALVLAYQYDSERCWGESLSTRRWKVLGTYMEWKAAGYQVRKGSKATYFCRRPMFGRHQVARKRRYFHPVA